jgi:hypothetical protein
MAVNYHGICFITLAPGSEMFVPDAKSSSATVGGANGAVTSDAFRLLCHKTFYDCNLRVSKQTLGEVGVF